MGWTLIQHTALTSSAASVTLGSGGTIPQTYKTLTLVISSRSDITPGYPDDGIFLAFNGSSSSYSNRVLYGNGTIAQSATNSYTTTKVYVSASNTSSSTTNTFASIRVDLPNYSGSTNKALSSDGVIENNATLAIQALNAGLWSNTAAITSIVITPNSGNFVSGSTFTLYGLS